MKRILSALLLSLLLAFSFAACYGKASNPPDVSVQSDAEVLDIEELFEDDTTHPETQAPSTVAATTVKPTAAPTTAKPAQKPKPAKTQPPTEAPAREEYVSPAEEEHNNEVQPQHSSTYVLNTSTKKFHYSDCGSVKTMKEKNKQEFTGSRDEIISMGYKPCKRCNP